MLTLPSQTVGVELTEIVPPSLAQVDAIAKKHFPSAIVDASLFRWNTRLTPQQMHQHLQNADTLAGPGWSSDSVEREWAAAVLDTIAAKTASLNKPGYRTADSYWLAAYVSNPGPVLDLEIAAGLLPPLLPVGQGVGFSSVFILTDRSAVVLTQAGVTDCVENVPDPSNQSLERTREA